MLRLIYIVIFSVSLMAGMSGCIEDGFTSSPNDQPEFSVDTLKFGTVFTAEGTPTHTFKVYNRHDKGLNISSISFVNPSDADIFRLNVDGLSGKSFENVEIRANDSIFILVEATIPENGRPMPLKLDAPLEFMVNGRTSKVVLSAVGQDVERIHGGEITGTVSLSAEKPYQIYDSLVVAEGASLTIPAGVSMFFHSGAELRVRGSLVVEGVPDSPVNMTGDRFGQVVGRIPYEVMSGQWGGVVFYGSSRGNRMSHASIRNTTFGVWIDSVSAEMTEPVLTLTNCQLRNSAGSVLTALYAPVSAVGCEFAEAAENVVALLDGKHYFNHCTFSNNYLFSSISGSILTFAGENVKADISNSIVYGLGPQLSPSDISDLDIRIRRTLLKPSGDDDDNFIECLWNQDPLFHTVRSEYIFDYRLHDDSPAIGAADPSLTDPRSAVDFYGNSRGAVPDLGAYVHTPDE